MAFPVGELAGVFAALAWAGGSLLFERLGRGNHASAGAINAAKCTVGLAVLFAAGLAVNGSPLALSMAPPDLALLAASAVIGLAIGDTAFFGALREIGVSRSVLLLSTAPIFAVLIESAVRGAFPPGNDLAGIALTLAGLGVVLLGQGGGPPPSPASSDSSAASVISAAAARPGRLGKGVALGALAGLSQGVGSLLSRAATRGSVDPLSASWLRLSVGLLTLLVVGTATGQARGWVRQLKTPGLFGRIAAASLLGTVLGLFLSQVSLARSSSGGVASTLLATSPIFALPLSHLWGGERITPRAVAGVALAFSGIALLLS
jgi:drug/metabolite transporter (DMT)-like permease